MKIKEMKYQADRKMELLHRGTYKKYNYYILNLGTHPTAYIEIPKGHKLYEKEYDDIDIDVHGGLTYADHELMWIPSENWYIGWDYAHLGDYFGGYEMLEPSILNTKDKKWTTEEIIKECESAIDQIIEKYEKKEKKSMLRLYEIPENQNVKLYFDKRVVIFGHIDGLYSYCWLEEDKNKIVHLKATTLFKKYKDGYKYVEEIK